MADETYLRIALVIVLVVTLSIGATHRLKAASSGEKISRKEEGYLFAVVLRLCGLLVALSILGHLIVPTYFEWATMPLPIWLRWAGAATGAVSTVLAYWTLSSLGKNLTDTVVTRSDATLVTHGPYRWVRHPFYVTAAFLLGSVLLLSASWLIGLLGAFVLTLLAIRTPKEEQMLVARFGQSYRDYMAKTGRYFPRF